MSEDENVGPTEYQILKTAAEQTKTASYHVLLDAIRDIKTKAVKAFADDTIDENEYAMILKTLKGQ